MSKSAEQRHGANGSTQDSYSWANPFRQGVRLKETLALDAWKESRVRDCSVFHTRENKAGTYVVSVQLGPIGNTSSPVNSPPLGPFWRRRSSGVVSSLASSLTPPLLCLSLETKVCLPLALHSAILLVKTSGYSLLSVQWASAHSRTLKSPAQEHGSGWTQVR